MKRNKKLIKTKLWQYLLPSIMMTAALQLGNIVDTMLVGNILGANIIDLTLILPISALVSGKALPIAPTSAMLDLPACLLVGGVAIIPTIFTQKFSRVQGVLLLGIYIVYVGMTCMAVGM